MVFVEGNKWVLDAMKDKGFHGITATVERANIGLRIVGPRETYEETSCHWEGNLGASCHEAPQQTIGAIFL